MFGNCDKHSNLLGRRMKTNLIIYAVFHIDKVNFRYHYCCIGNEYYEYVALVKGPGLSLGCNCSIITSLKLEA